MAGRRCPRCPAIITNGARYCPACARQYDQQRGSSTARGYGAEHRATRAALVVRMRQGETIRCVDCGLALDPATLDLGHTDDRAGYKGPQCRVCNRSDGGKRAHRQV